MRDRLPAAEVRREAICVALAAAEVCWEAPLFLALNRLTTPHPPLLLWLGMLVLLLGYFYLYRALAKADLTLRLQQGLLVVALLLSMALFLRYHVYAGAEWRGADLFSRLFRPLLDVAAAMPAGWVAMMALVYFWARGIHLARHSLSADSVGFSFRAGIVLLILATLVVRLFTGEDAAGFVMPFFFFALVAVGLARTEEVSRLPRSGSGPAGFAGFWLGSTVGAVALLMLVGMVVAAFFSGGGLRQVLRWLSPLWSLVQILVVGVAVLILMLLDLVLSLLQVDLGAIGDFLRQMMQDLSRILAIQPATLPPGSEAETRPPILGILHAVITVAIPAVTILLVVLFTWNRVRRGRRQAGDESRESLLSAGAVASSLRAMLQAGLDRLGDLAGLVDRFGLGARFLSAISIRRIYANLVRLAAEAGYPRMQSQTPYEYLETLHQALPGSEVDVAVITEAYVNAHYGQVPDGREDLQRIRDCWERVRGREEERRGR
jgi:hypothetical protein